MKKIIIAVVMPVVLVAFILTNRAEPEKIKLTKIVKIKPTIKTIKKASVIKMPEIKQREEKLTMKKLMKMSREEQNLIPVLKRIAVIQKFSADKEILTASKMGEDHGSDLANLKNKTFREGYKGRPQTLLFLNQNMNLTAGELGELKQLENIEHVSVTIPLDENLISKLNEMKNLKALTLRGTQLKPENIKNLYKLKNINTLTLYRAEEIGHKAMLEIMEAMPNVYIQSHYGGKNKRRRKR